MPASSVTERWEARFAASGEDRAQPSTWQLDALWREACREAQEADTAALRAAVARMRERENSEPRSSARASTRRAQPARPTKAERWATEAR